MKIEKIGLEPLITEELRKKSSAALDYLWEEAWVKAAVRKTDRARETMIQEMAKEFEEKSDVVIVAADGLLAEQIRAVVSALPQDEGRAQVQVFGGTLSPFSYGELLTALQEKDFSLIAVAAEEETVPLRGAYACLKQLILSKYGAEGAAGRLMAVAGSQSKLLSMEAADNDFPMLRFPAGVSPGCAANTEAVLLPLAISGADTGQYLEGFYDMLASPFWDLDGADYGLARAACRKQSGLQEELWIWQAQLRPFGIWREYAARQMPVRMLSMPEAAPLSDRRNFCTTVLVEEDEEDIMMPFFEGCNQDGSLNLLLRESAEKRFCEENGAPKVKIAVEQMDAYALGQLMAFTQLSDGITDYLLR